MRVDAISDLLLYSQPGVRREDYLAAVLDALAAVFPSDSAGWNKLDLDAGKVELAGFPPEVFGPDAPTAAALVRVEDHPMVISYLQNQEGSEPRRLTDLVSLTDLHRTDAYHELLHPVDAEYQFTLVTERLGARTAACWTFNRRSHDFTDDELDLAIHLQGMLAIIEKTWTMTTSLPVGTPLTKRELEVLSLVAHGLTAHAVGFRLGISEKTVRKHMENAYRKLHVSDRVLAVAAVHQLGLIP